MARFDVCRSRRSGTFLLDVQADVHSTLDTRVVVPLLPIDKTLPNSLPRLHPRFEVDGVEVRMATHLVAATLKADLGSRIATLEDHSYEITAALDILLTGV